MPTESTLDRITRMLAMMGYLADHDRVPVGELAEHFGVTESQVLKDIDLLWVTGTPGYYPDDLVDFSVDDWEESLISLRDARGLGRRVPWPLVRHSRWRPPSSGCEVSQNPTSARSSPRWRASCTPRRTSRCPTASITPSDPGSSRP